jgi:citrate lyase beta subunit
MITPKFFRSILYMPASNPKALLKSTTLRQCDGFIYDLEDAVGIDFKLKARKDIETFLLDSNKSLFHPTQSRIVRVNGNSTSFYNGDVETCSRIKPDAVLLPKAQCKEDVLKLKNELLGSECEVWSMIETPLGVINAFEIAQVSDCLVMGTVDLANDLKCSVDYKLNRSPLLTSLQLTVLAARAANIKVLDGVYTAITDEVGFRKEVLQGLELGFDGKTLIHPKTIDIVNEIFSPSQQAIEHAHKIIEAYNKSGGVGATLLDGKTLVEELHVRRAKKLLDMVEGLKTRNNDVVG